LFQRNHLQAHLRHWYLPTELRDITWKKIINLTSLLIFTCAQKCGEYVKAHIQALLRVFIVEHFFLNVAVGDSSLKVFREIYELQS
jgi:hypothetical protein